MKTKILVVFFLCFSFQFSFAQVAKSKNITTKQVKNLSSSNPNIGNGSEIIARADIKAMAESLVNLTIKAPNSNTSPISIKEQNLNFLTIERIAKKLAILKQLNIQKSGTITKKEKKEQLADIKAMAESLVNLTIKNNTNLNNISRKEKLADIKAMAESLVNLTMKN